MTSAERDISQAERSASIGLTMVLMAGLVAYQGANMSPEYRPMEYVFSGLWLGLAGINFRTAIKLAHRERLPFQHEPVLVPEPLPDTQTLALQIGLEG